MIEFTVYGQPATQGSKRHVGNGVMIESNKSLKPWRAEVKAAAREAIEHGSERYLDGPVCASIYFTVRKPTSAPKRRRVWPAKKPDLDKLLRAVLDALTDSGVLSDDAQIVSIFASKRYPGEGFGALDVPGVRVELWQLSSYYVQQVQLEAKAAR